MIGEMLEQFTALPRPGTSAQELTYRDRLAIAIAAGAEVETTLDGGLLTARTLRTIGVADRR